MNSGQTSSLPEQIDPVAVIREHLECALRLMEELRPASASAARCQELIDSLDGDSLISQ